MMTNDKAIVAAGFLYLALLFPVQSFCEAASQSVVAPSGTLIIKKLPPPELYAHENKMISTLDYDESAEASKARVERARKQSFVWIQIDDQPKQKLTREKNLIIRDLSLDQKHVFKIVADSGVVTEKYTIDFPNMKSRKVFISYSPGYGNWTMYPM